MQAIPEDAVQEDSGDEEEEDPNKRISSKNPSHRPFSSVHAAQTASAEQPRSEFLPFRFVFSPSSRQKDSL